MLLLISLAAFVDSLASRLAGGVWIETASQVHCLCWK